MLLHTGFALRLKHQQLPFAVTNSSSLSPLRVGTAYARLYREGDAPTSKSIDCTVLVARQLYRLYTLLPVLNGGQVPVR